MMWTSAEENLGLMWRITLRNRGCGGNVDSGGHLTHHRLQFPPVHRNSDIVEVVDVNVENCVRCGENVGELCKMWRPFEENV